MTVKTLETTTFLQFEQSQVAQKPISASARAKQGAGVPAGGELAG